ncbi:MAG: gliding motility-associated C-terminal domain-containing protein [Bacteroidales bacterium]|nr:gliding motility-associated C-terminal domain-containing protein [Bacteroidales bacterium]
MNILQKVMAVASALMLTLNMSIAQDASKKQMAYFVTGDTVMCDAGAVRMAVYLDLDPQVVFTLTWIDEMIVNGTVLHTDEYSIPNRNVPNSHVFVEERNIDLSADSEGKHVTHRLILQSVRSQATGEVAVCDTMIVDMWGTPTARIMNDEKVCSDAVTLEADDRWSDVSAYRWSASLRDGTSIDLKDADSKSCLFNYPRESDVAITVSLAESTGYGKCVSEVSKQMNFLQVPTAYLKHLDDEGVESEVRICSSVKDEAFDFEGIFNLAGHEPFDVVMSNGQTFEQLPAGETTQLLHNESSHSMHFSRITDANQCVVEYPNARLSGLISIVDRKPIVSVPTDTLSFSNSREAVIPVKLSDLGSDFFFKVRRDSIFEGKYKVDNIISKESKKWLGDKEGQWSFKTNKTGMLYIDYYEMNYEVFKGDTLVNCPSEKVLQCVETYDEVNAPNGISPNADWKNDYLVIQGLPDNNHLAVYDRRGKVIFEKTNYRNDWNAEGVEDGYYVYTFEGDGIKTIKETLVIKRSK